MNNSSPVSNKVRGVVHLITRTYGIVEADDGVHRFFMPTDIRSPHVFRDLKAKTDLADGTHVEGEPYEHRGRPRIRAIVVVVPDSQTVTHGAAS
jgi:hypothetical protein